MIEYGHTAGPYIHALLEKLGVVKGATDGVLKVMDFLKKPPKVVERMNETTYRYFSDDHRRHIDVGRDVQRPPHLSDGFVNSTKVEIGVPESVPPFRLVRLQAHGGFQMLE